MTPEDLLRRAGDQLSVRRVFGEPVEREGTLVIPVAVAIGGGGGGTAPTDQGGEGGGFGGIVRGIGVYAIRDGQVRFVPAIDLTALALVTLLTFRVVLRRGRAGAGWRGWVTNRRSRGEDPQGRSSRSSFRPRAG